jgi:two-component system, LytTR family, response regulator
MQLRAIIIDDEAVARERLRRLLAKTGRVQVVAECADGKAAVAAIVAERPDLVFLDVQMPEMNGFDVVRAIGVERMPAVVFVTAFDRFALQAFEVHALDYLLKPFGDERVQQALARAETFLTGAGKLSQRNQLATLIGAQGKTAAADCLLVKDGDRFVLVRPEEIDWIEANGDYVRLHTGAESHFIRATMIQMEERLGGGFVRIHRSRLVNLARIKELHPLMQGESVVILKNGTRLNASQNCLKQFQDRFDLAG